MPINEYLKQVKQRYNTGISTEHTYRGDLQVLLNNLVPKITVTNEPKRQKCGAPDYIIQNKEVPLGYIEAKDIGINLDKVEKSDQMKRYLGSLDNLILTDYLEFRFYKFGSKTHTLKLAVIDGGKVKFVSESFSIFETYINDFCSFKGQTIKSAEKLAKMMAQKARMMEEVLYNAVKNDDEDNSLKDQLEAFRHILIHDLDEKTFADIYSQTIAYGLFVARLHDETLEDFSRQEARELIPRSNPFLRNLFYYVSGDPLDDRVVWIVNDLCEIFRATDLQSILSDFGKSTGQNDPFLHFYETFLAEYDPKLRKSRGVYYTPEPVVNFIVRAVDDILKEEFNLPKGLADTSKVKIKRKIDGTATKKGKDVFEEVDVHKVQILDPATGTGTFLAETVKQIYSKFKGQEGLWSSYVESDLIPRINGFEILMASYTMCHLKLEMLLNETGYKPKKDSKQPRLKVYLTNSLEEVHPDTGTLFASWLARESTEANYVKRDTPVMCVIGNPPYSGISSNNGEWISNLIDDYKYIDGVHFNERKHWLNDDYVKFLRYGQHYIEKNGSGVLAFINPHGFLDNPTFRGMRWHLLKTYDKIYTIDLHGNSKKKETAPDGSADINVFDIQQGVSINIFVKTAKKKANELGLVFHCDVFGKRDYKYNFLNKNHLESIKFEEINFTAPYYFFIPKDEQGRENYYNGISVIKLFETYTTGFVSARDVVNISFDLKEARGKLEFICSQEEAQIREKFGIKKDSRDWTVKTAKEDALSNKATNLFKHFPFRPFDYRYTFYTGTSRGLYSSPQKKVLNHMLRENLALVTSKQANKGFRHAIVTNTISDFNLTGSAGKYGSGYVFPIYLYSESNGQKTIGEETERRPNIKTEIVEAIAESLGLTFTHEKEPTENTFAPIDILDYIYAVLHSPSYREKYKEFLKIDFPRVPYPKNTKLFWKLVNLGGELRTIHLLENPVVEDYITSYPIDGSNMVEKPLYKNGKAFINKEQYFDKVPDVAWTFYIGGYQPAQKWLKDRKGRELSVDDILHYQKIIVALTETDRIMKEIDKVMEL